MREKAILLCNKTIVFKSILLMIRFNRNQRAPNKKINIIELDTSSVKIKDKTFNEFKVFDEANKINKIVPNLQKEEKQKRIENIKRKLDSIKYSTIGINESTQNKISSDIKHVNSNHSEKINLDNYKIFDVEELNRKLDKEINLNETNLNDTTLISNNESPDNIKYSLNPITPPIEKDNVKSVSVKLDKKVSINDYEIGIDESKYVIFFK